MVFPATPLQVRVDLQIAGVWTNVTSDALNRDGITVARGRADEASRADPSVCNLTFKNQAGKYSPRNPTSPYYGVLGRNTPLRVGIGTPPVGAGTAGLTGVSLTAPSVIAEVAGQLTCAWLAAPVGNVTPPGTFTADLDMDGSLSTFRGARKLVLAGATGVSTATFSVPATAAAAMSVIVPGVTTSIATQARAVDGVSLAFPVNHAAFDYLLAFYGWSSDPEDLMQAAVSDADGASEWMLVADTGPSTGPRIKAYMRPMFFAGPTSVLFRGRHDIATAGGPDTYGYVTTLTGADYFPRFTGEVSQWPPRWDTSGRDVWVPVTASGISRRLGQGAAPLRSALRREFLTAKSVVGYWPLEDAAGATSFASAVGGSPMTFLGAPSLAADDGFAAADALPTFTAAGARGTVPTYTSTDNFLAGALISIPLTGLPSESNLLTVTCTGTIRTWTVSYYAPAAAFRVQAFDATGAVLWNTLHGPWTPSLLGSRFFLYLTARPVGADARWDLKYIPIVPGSDSPVSSGATNTVVANTVGAVTSVAVGAGQDLTDDPTFGHVIVTSDYLALFTSSVWRSLVAWNGEQAASRFVRLCREEGIQYHLESGSVSELMGPQRPGPLLTLLGECEDTDGGVLHEPKGFLGLAFRTRESKSNQTAVTLPYGDISEPFEPTDDDQGIVNDVTVTRIGGSSARATLDTGALSTLPPPAGIGRYDTAFDLSLDDDTQLPDQASWRLHLGTWDESRYPSVHIDLAASPNLVAGVLDTDVGDLVSITGLPTWVPPGPVDLVAEGYTEAFGHPNSWDVTFNCTPGGPHRVVELDSARYARLDTDNSFTNGAINTTQTTVFTRAAPSGSTLWVSTALNPGEFPFDVVIGGEVMTATAIVTTSATDQTWTVVRSVNGVVKSHVIGVPVHVAEPVVLAL